MPSLNEQRRSWLEIKRMQDSITETASTAFRPVTIRLEWTPSGTGKRNAAGPERGQDFQQNKGLILRFPTNYAS
jgi:hypothetical protein